MKKVFNFVKGKKDEKKDTKLLPQISVEITSPSGQRVSTDDDHKVGLQHAHGYNIDVSGKDKSLPKLHKAAWFGNLDKIKLNLKKFDINTPDYLNRTCLHLAVAQGHTEIAWFLLNNNASISACDDNGLTPFLKAVECGHKDCTNLLIECGVDVNSCDTHGNTAIHIAAKSGFYNIASLLLKEKANLNVANNAGEFALHVATNCDRKEMVELLLRYGASVDVLDRERRTPLMYAARNGFSSIIKVLVDNGAVLDAADSNGWTAEDYSQFGGHQDTNDFLKSLKTEKTQQDQSEKQSVQSLDQSESIQYECDAPQDLQDSSASLVIPPALDPPKSWDFIQSGVMDESEFKDKKSPNFSKHLKADGPKLSALSPSDGVSMEMRLSPEPMNRDLHTPERRIRSPLERTYSLDLSSDHDSPVQKIPIDEDLILKSDETALIDRDENYEEHNENNNILKVDNVKLSNHCFLPNNNHQIFESLKLNNLSASDSKREISPSECFQSCENLEERYFSSDTSSLNNIDMNGKSLSIEIIQSTGNLDETLSICTISTKNVFRESHSLEILEDGKEHGKSRNKIHSRNKSITLTGQPQFWKSIDVLHKSNSYEKGSIDEQLICYDEALRQLAKVNIPKPKVDDEIEKQSPGSECDLPFPQANEMCDLIAPFPVENMESDNLFEKDTVFPPPPIHFLENSETELVGFEPYDNNENLLVNLPLPISMLTPIKENQQETDSVSLNFDNHSKLDETCEDHETNSGSSYESQDVFLDDGNMHDNYSKYFVDMKALQCEPSEVNLRNVTIPSNSPSPKLIADCQENQPGNARKFHSLDFVVGGVCHAKCNRASDLVSSNELESVSEQFGRPLKKKRKRLLDMRGTGMSGNTTDTEGKDVEEDDSEEEDPPFWHNTNKGGFFTRQDTVLALQPALTKIKYKDVDKSQASLEQKVSCGTPTYSSDAETASASDAPGLTQPSEAGNLDKDTLTLLDKAARLKYELEDYKLAEATREEAILILQTQLNRLECQYAIAQEELCTFRQRATATEHELSHLRELCTQLNRSKTEMYNELSQQLKSSTDPDLNAEHSSNNHLHIMIKHLEDEKRQEEDKTKRLVHHLEEVILTNQAMLSERELLISQNIADVRKLQEDTICWKERYEELAAKLEMVEKKQDPRLIEAEDTIATLKRTIALLQQEKSLIIPKHFDAATNTNSPSAKIHKTLDLQKDLKKVDNEVRQRKAMLQSLQQELAKLMSRLDENIFQQLRTGSLNQLSEYTIPSKVLQSIDTEMSNVKKVHNTIDMLIKELQQCTEAEDSVEDQLYFSIHEAAQRKLIIEASKDTKYEIYDKLNGINELIRHQIHEQSRLEKARISNELSLKQKLENINETLQTELINIQTAITGSCQGKGCYAKVKPGSIDSDKYNFIEKIAPEEYSGIDVCVSKRFSVTEEGDNTGTTRHAGQSLEEKIQDDLKEKYLNKK